MLMFFACLISVGLYNSAVGLINYIHYILL